MIEKIFPRKLNSDKDARLMGPNEMLDALNVSVSNDTGPAPSDGTGSLGVLKPKKGNASIPVVDQYFSDTQNKRVLGSVSDETLDVVFFFVWSPIQGEQGVYAYDKFGRLPGSGTNRVVEVFTSNRFAFPSSGFVKGDIVHTGQRYDSTEGGTFDRKVMLYFTDNINEPRKIDVFRAMDSAASDYDQMDIKDFITACPKTPFEPIRFNFSPDLRGIEDGTPARRASGFDKTRGMQFAYQHIYKSGEESAISTYSVLAVPPSYTSQGTLSVADIQSHGKLSLIIPYASSSDNTLKNRSRDIETVRILGRNGNVGDFFVIDEVVADPGVDIKYAYYNDRVVTGVPQEDFLKQFDNLPIVAEAQSVVSDRLVYGNYIEGYDEVKTDSIGQPVFKERAADFFNYQLNAKKYIYQPSGDASEPVNREAGFKISAEGFPDSLPGQSVINISLTVTAEKNFHLYNSHNSFHGTRQGRLSGEGVPNSDLTDGDFIFPQSETISTLFHEGEQTPDQTFTDFGGDRLFGLNEGISPLGGDAPKWRVTDSANEGAIATALLDTEVEVVYGTSATNPFILKGDDLNFYFSFSIANQIPSGAKAIIISALKASINGTSLPSGVNVLSSQSETQYTYDLQLGDDDEILCREGNDERKNLIVAVGNKEDLLGGSEISADNGRHMPPCGYFIVDKATPQISLKAHPLGEGAESLIVSLRLSQLSGVSVKTCIPSFFNPYDPDVPGFISTNEELTAENSQIFSDFYAFHLDRYRVYSKGYITENEIDTGSSIFTNHDDIPNTIDIGNQDFGNDQGEAEFDQLLLTARIFNASYHKNRYRIAGYLNFSDNFETGGLVDVSVDNRYSFLDGISGPGTALDPIFENGYGSVSGLSMWTGHIHQYAISGFFDNNTNLIPIQFESLLPRLSFGPDALSLELEYIYNVYENSQEVNASNPGLRYDFFNQEGESFLELLEFSSWSSIGGLDQASSRSFKTSANHDFAIVYYDERGRAGFANPLNSVYVPGYSEQERGQEKGRVEIQMSLNHSPPDWAHQYQIVYAGNSSVSKFIQYTSGGAFSKNDLDASEETESFVFDSQENSTENSNNIFVSLNYLQENSEVSYSKSFGAVNNEGGNKLYSYVPGDKLRIVSYFNDNEYKLYPYKYEFEVVGVQSFSQSIENPFYNSDSENDQNNLAAKAKSGEFLILKDNPAALGFTLADVRNAENEIDQTSHKWNSRTVVEIFSVASQVDKEERVYYETGSVHNVGFSNDERVHQTNPVRLNQGDVWWRRIPVNIANYNNESGAFNSIIRVNDSLPNFKNVFLESESFNDTHPGTRQQHFGKPKFVFPGVKQTRKRSSITYSDKNNYASKAVRFTSFNQAKAPFKNLPNEYGSVNFLLNNYDSLFVVQENKISAIPVSRNIISDASGSPSLIATSKILGTQKFYAGVNGCDNNPESVTRAGENIYFANKSRREVYKWNSSNGVQVISDAGMKTYFDNLFYNAINNSISQQSRVRVTGGYDPQNDEFILSVLNFAPQISEGSTDIPGEGGDVYGDIPNLTVIDESIDEDLSDFEGSSSSDVIEDLEGEVEDLNNQIDVLEDLVADAEADVENVTEDLNNVLDILSEISSATNQDDYGTVIEDFTISVNNETITVSFDNWTSAINQASSIADGLQTQLDDVNDSRLSALVQRSAATKNFLESVQSYVDLVNSFESIINELSLNETFGSLQDEVILIQSILDSVVEIDASEFNSNGSPFNYIIYAVSNVSTNAWTGQISDSIAVLSGSLVGEETLSSFSDIVAEAVSNVQTTSENTEEQLRNMFLAVDELKDSQQNDIFKSIFGEKVQSFINGKSLIEAFDTNEDGVFDSDEIVSQGDLNLSMQNKLTSVISSFGASEAEAVINAIMSVVTATDSEEVPSTTEGIKNYIDKLEQAVLDAADITPLTADDEALLEDLNVLQNDYYTLIGDADLGDDQLDWFNLINAGEGENPLVNATNTSSIIAILGELLFTSRDDLTTSDADLETAQEDLIISEGNQTTLSSAITKIRMQIGRLLQNILLTGFSPLTLSEVNTYNTEANSDLAQNLTWASALESSEDNTFPDRTNEIVDQAVKAASMLKGFQDLLSSNVGNLQNNPQFGEAGFYREEGLIGTLGGNESFVAGASADDISAFASGTSAQVMNFLSVFNQAGLEATAGSISQEDLAGFYLPDEILQAFSSPINPTEAANIFEFLENKATTGADLSTLLKSLKVNINDANPQAATFSRLGTDFDGDAEVGSADLLIFLSAFGGSLEEPTGNFRWNPNGGGYISQENEDPQT